VTCHRFSRLQPVAAVGDDDASDRRGVKPPRRESGDKSPHSKKALELGGADFCPDEP
jgi:hypothetical protein